MRQTREDLQAELTETRRRAAVARGEKPPPPTSSATRSKISDSEWYRLTPRQKREDLIRLLKEQGYSGTFNQQTVRSSAKPPTRRGATNAGRASAMGHRSQLRGSAEHH